MTKGIQPENVNRAIIEGVPKTNKFFNKIGPAMKTASIAGEIVGFTLVATQNTPAATSPLPVSEAEKIEIGRTRTRFGIPLSANIDKHGHLKTNSYLQVDIFDPHVGDEFEQETEELLWWLGLDVTYRYSGATWTVPGRKW